MKLIIAAIILAGCLLTGASASAMDLGDLQPQAGYAGANNNPQTDSSGFGLQPAGQLGQSGSNPLSGSDFDSNPPAVLGASTFSRQNIMGEADPNPPAEHSNWLPIGFFVSLGLAVILGGYMLISNFTGRQLQPVEAEN